MLPVSRWEALEVMYCGEFSRGEIFTDSVKTDFHGVNFLWMACFHIYAVSGY